MRNNAEKRQLLEELLTQAEKVRKENVFKAASLGKPAYDLAEELDDQNGMAKAIYYIYIGHHYGKKENSQHLLKKALQMVSADEDVFIVRFYNLLGLENLKRGCCTIAMDYFNEGLSLAQKSENKGLLCMILNNTGEVFRQMGDFNRAVAYYHEAYGEGSDESGDISNLCIYSIENLVSSYSHLGDYKKANYYLQCLSDIQPKLQSTFQRSRYSFAKGCYLKGMEKYEEAIGCFDMFLEQVENLNVISSKLEGYKHLGDCYEGLDKKYEAVECYSLAYDLSIEAGVGEEEMYCASQLAKIYKELNQLEKSLEFHERFTKKVYEWNEITLSTRSDYIVQKIQYDELKAAKAFVEEEHRRILVGHEAVQKAYQRLDLAVAIGNAIKSNPSYKALLLLLHSQVKKMMPLASIAIGRYIPDTKIVKMAYIVDDQRIQDDLILDLKRPEKFNIKTCIQTREPVLFRTRLENKSEHLADYKYQDAYDEIQSGIYIPIIARDEVIGVLTVQSKEAYVYGEEDLKVLEVISAYFAQINFKEK